MSNDYRNNHYVTQWHQKKFMRPGEHELYCLDLKPDTFTDPRGVTHTRKPLRKQGSRMCFVEKDLYTTRIRGIETKDIEKYFFGDIDSAGRASVNYFEGFTYPLKEWGSSLEDIMRFMSTQKLRTPKGLAFLSGKLGHQNKDALLHEMIRLQQLHCAAWVESVWLIADASQSATKFIVSDHPVTVYNRECGPRSDWCRGTNDPDIWLHGTHTMFPLSLEKVLILTNLSWVRNPYQSAIKPRPNPNPFRNTIFKYTDIKIERYLSEEEVRQINFIIKSRAYRYVAAGAEDWLYPEKFVSKSDWSRFGHGYLLMPDPRGIHIGGEILMGFKDGRVLGMDEYGRRPWDRDYNKESKNQSETDTLQWFQGEFANLFGPYRRGRSGQFGDIDKERDSDEFHQYHLSLQKRFYKERKRRSKL